MQVHQVAVHYGQLPETIYNLSIDEFDEMMDFMAWEAKDNKKAQQAANKRAQAQR